MRSIDDLLNSWRLRRITSKELPVRYGASSDFELASDPEATTAQLTELATHPAAMVRWQVAINPRTPAALVATLDDDEAVECIQAGFGQPREVRDRYAWSDLGFAPPYIRVERTVASGGGHA